MVGDDDRPGGLAEAALVVAVEALPDDEFLRLVEIRGDPLPLLVPYVVRSVPLMPPMAGHIPTRSGTAEP